MLMIAAAGMLLSSCNTKTETIVEVLPAEPTVAIEFVGSPGVSSVTAKFVPTENASRYVFALGNDQNRVSFENDELTGTIQELTNNERTQDWEDLEAETYYVLYARAYNAAGEAGPVSALGFKTNTSDFMVSTYYVGETSAGFLITNTNDYYTYSYAFASPAPEDKEKFLNGLLDKTVVQNEVFEWVGNDLNLLPNTDYVFYCRGIDRSGRETQLFEIPFKTAAENSNEIPNFTWRKGELQDFYAQEYIVTPNELCKQVVLYQQTPGDRDQTMFGVNNYKGRVMDFVDTYKDIATEKNVSTFTATNEELIATPKNKSFELGAPMELYILAYDEMYKPYQVKRFDTSTPSFDENAAIPTKDEIELTITSHDTAKETVNFAMTTTENVRAYIFDIVEVAYFESEFDGDYKKLRDYFIANYNGGVIEGFVYNQRSTTVPYTYTAQNKRGDYFMAAVGMNVNGPVASSADGTKNGWAEEITISKTFTMPEKQ